MSKIQITPILSLRISEKCKLCLSRNDWNLLDIMKTCHYSLNLKIHFETLRVFCTTLRINLNSRYIIIKNSRYKVLITIKRRKCDQELKFILFYFSTLIQFFEVNFLSIDNYVHYSEFVSLHPVTLIVINYLCRILWFLGIHCRIYFKQSSMKFISLSSVVMKIKFCGAI